MDIKKLEVLLKVIETKSLTAAGNQLGFTQSGVSHLIKTIEDEFGFPVLSIANVREIFDAAAKMKNPDGTPLLSHDIQQRAAAYLEEYGA